MAKQIWEWGTQKINQSGVWIRSVPSDPKSWTLDQVPWCSSRETNVLVLGPRSFHINFVWMEQNRLEIIGKCVIPRKFCTNRVSVHCAIHYPNGCIGPLLYFWLFRFPTVKAPGLTELGNANWIGIYQVGQEEISKIIFRPIFFDNYCIYRSRLH